MFTFRLLAGQHVQDKPPTGVDAEGKPVYSIGPDGLREVEVFDWRFNNIVQSKIDLVERYNSKDPGLMQKFERITDSQGEMIRKEREEARRWALERLRREQQVSPTEFPGAPMSQNPLAVAQSDAHAPDFDRMSERDLRQHAADEEVDIEGAENRADVLRRVKEARSLSGAS